MPPVQRENLRPGEVKELSEAVVDFAIFILLVFQGESLPPGSQVNHTWTITWLVSSQRF